MILTRILFNINISKIVANDHQLVNIDETSFSKGTKTNYSWTPMSKNGELLNSKYINFMNIVLAIFYNGNWIVMLTIDTLNEERFIFS